MTTYTYDGVGQLTKESESNGTTQAYTYDRNGNRTKLTATGSEYYTVVYTYDAANRLTKETRTEGSTVTWTDYTYDSNGNVLTKTNKSGMGVIRSEGNEYNGYNQLVTQTVNEAGIITDLAYEYYPSGIRSVKAVDGVPTVYVANNGYVVAEYYETTLTAVYLWGANLIKSGIGSTTSYYMYNAHGDVVQLTSTTGAVVRNYTYDAFGVEDDPDDFDTNPFRYCGEYYDRESKTYYLRARYYDPALGRFTQQDILNQGINYYSYCKNSPISYLDSNGCYYMLAYNGSFFAERQTYIDSICQCLYYNIGYQPIWYYINGYTMIKEGSSYKQIMGQIDGSDLIMDDIENIIDRTKDAYTEMGVISPKASIGISIAETLLDLAINGDPYFEVSKRDKILWDIFSNTGIYPESNDLKHLVNSMEAADQYIIDHTGMFVDNSLMGMSMYEAGYLVANGNTKKLKKTLRKNCYLSFVYPSYCYLYGDNQCMKSVSPYSLLNVKGVRSTANELFDGFCSALFSALHEEYNNINKYYIDLFL